jgi:DNA-binding LytR/AlgR family response regulator
MRDFLFLKDSKTVIQIFYHDLKYIEATGRYVRFVTTSKSYVVTGRLQNVSRRLPGHLFCRIHKSTIVAFRHVAGFTYDAVLIGKQHLPIGKQYRSSFFSQADILDAARGDGGNASNGMDTLLKDLNTYPS